MGSFLKQRITYGDRGNVGRYKIPDDNREHKIRPLPFDEDGRWQFPVLQHWAVDPKSDEGKPKAYICPMHQPSSHNPPDGETNLPSFDKPCPFCSRLLELQDELDNDNDLDKVSLKVLKAKIGKMRPTRSHFIWMKDCDDPSMVKRFTAARTCYDEILKAYTGTAMQMTEVETMEELQALEDDQIPDLFDWDLGHNVLITKAKDGKSKKTIFHAAISGKKTAAWSDAGVKAKMMVEVKDPLKVIRHEMNEQSDTIDEACTLFEEEVERKARRSKGRDDDEGPNLSSRHIADDEDDDLPPSTRPKANESRTTTKPAATTKPKPAPKEEETETPSDTFVDEEEEEFIGKTTTKPAAKPQQKFVDEEEDLTRAVPTPAVKKPSAKIPAPVKPIPGEVEDHPNPAGETKAQRRARLLAALDEEGDED